MRKRDSSLPLWGAPRETLSSPSPVGSQICKEGTHLLPRGAWAPWIPPQECFPKDTSKTFSSSSHRKRTAVPALNFTKKHEASAHQKILMKKPAPEQGEDSRWRNPRPRKPLWTRRRFLARALPVTPQPSTHGQHPGRAAVQAGHILL